MKVYDCFPFFNELDLLELRLQELWDTVDYFVIAEANSTFCSNPKPFNIELNFDRFKKYWSKIRYIMVTDMPRDPNPWVNEGFQRWALVRGLDDLQPDDLVIISDCDEIPRPSAIEFIKNDAEDHDRYQLCHPLFFFKLNYLRTIPDVHEDHGNIVATRGRVFTNPGNERGMFGDWPDCKRLHHGGWHFTYFGDNAQVITKIQNFSHQEENVPEVVNHINVEEMIRQKLGLKWTNSDERFEYVKVDEYYPKTITDNLDKWQHMIIAEETKSVYDFYKTKVNKFSVKNYNRDQYGVIHQIESDPFTYDPLYIDKGYGSFKQKVDEMAYLRLGYILGNIHQPINSILDVGYGTGDFLKTCSNIIPNCYGNDLFNDLIPAGCTFINDITTQHYDVITFFDSLEHHPSLDFVKDLKCNYVAISLPWCHYHSDEWFINWKHLKPDEHLHHFNDVSLNNFMSANGFELIAYSNVEDTIRKPVDSYPNILTAVFKKI
jgi:Glycosyltransferase family 17/Methyltransferase domain